MTFLLQLSPGICLPSLPPLPRHLSDPHQGSRRLHCQENGCQIHKKQTGVRLRQILAFVTFPFKHTFLGLMYGENFHQLQVRHGGRTVATFAPFWRTDERECEQNLLTKNGQMHHNQKYQAVREVSRSRVAHYLRCCSRWSTSLCKRISSEDSCLEPNKHKGPWITFASWF